MSSAEKPALDIAAGVLIKPSGEVLIAQRRPGTDGAGKWEFPGGKVESGESNSQALVRELREEIGIEVKAARPLLAFSHKYSHRLVRLQMWLVTEWTGMPTGCEGQTLAWATTEQLPEFDLLAANKPIVDALRLPDRYLITPDIGSDSVEGFLGRLSRAVAAGAGLVRLRQTALSDADYIALATPVAEWLAHAGVGLLLDRQVDMRGIHGVHLSMAAARKTGRPAGTGWFGLSCHDRGELEEALVLGADFATLSPVCATRTHPDAEALGWAAFERHITGLPLPVYALGGLDSTQVAKAHESGAQGVAAIRGFWGAVDE